MTRQEERLEADVLVLGGGPAGAWAAWSAASLGAKVILADKGYLGTSGRQPRRNDAARDPSRVGASGGGRSVQT